MRGPLPARLLPQCQSENKHTHDYVSPGRVLFKDYLWFRATIGLLR